ncbi:MAG: hypothetical protein IPM91_18885 [Bacteroidetes bacterium]|nr:hypothetical protein [Bacteroidota bacterium]
MASAGNYSVVVSANGACSATSQIIPVTVNSNPTASISANGNTTFCQGGSVNLTANGGSSYVWSTGQSGFLPLRLPLQDLTVHWINSQPMVVRATSNNINLTVATNPTAAVTVNGPTVLNTGQTTTLTATGGNSYLWQPGGQTTSSIIVNSAGSYSVTATNASGCTNTSSAVTISMNNAPSPVVITTAGAAEFCAGGNLQLSANGGSNYIWAPTGQTTPTITVNQPGTYYVYSRNSSGLVTSKDSITVKMAPTPMNPWISIAYFPKTA